jgi:hypothetical protein
MKKKFVIKKELVHLKNELAQIAAVSHTFLCGYSGKLDKAPKRKK